MSRIDKSNLANIAKDIQARPSFAALLGHEVVAALVLDLSDAYAEIDRLRAFSTSQEEALRLMEEGKL